MDEPEHILEKINIVDHQFSQAPQTSVPLEWIPNKTESFKDYLTFFSRIIPRNFTFDKTSNLSRKEQLALWAFSSMRDFFNSLQSANEDDFENCYAQWLSNYNDRDYRPDGFKDQLREHCFSLIENIKRAFHKLPVFNGDVYLALPTYNDLDNLERDLRIGYHFKAGFLTASTMPPIQSDLGYMAKFKSISGRDISAYSGVQGDIMFPCALTFTRVGFLSNDGRCLKIRENGSLSCRFSSSN